MFTDIVGSTEQAAAMGDSRWRELMSHHDALVNVELERYRGRAVKSMGDGFLATLDGPARGIRCARAIQEAARAFHLEIRAGLHTGECELLDNDIGGLAVHIGARIGALANADEVLVSRTVKDLVIGSGIMFIDRGSKELKGVPGRWNLFAVESVEEPASDHVVPDARERRPQDRTIARAARRSPKLVGRIRLPTQSTRQPPVIQRMSLGRVTSDGSACLPWPRGQRRLPDSRVRGQVHARP